MDNKTKVLKCYFKSFLRSVLSICNTDGASSFLLMWERRGWRHRHASTRLYFLFCEAEIAVTNTTLPKVLYYISVTHSQIFNQFYKINCIPMDTYCDKVAFNGEIILLGFIFTIRLILLLDTSLWIFLFTVHAHMKILLPKM